MPGVSRAQMMAILRERNWGFKRQGKHAEIWKLKGETNTMPLPTLKHFTEREARAVLSRSGMTRDEIDDAIQVAVAAGGADD